ncbi:alpha-L-fucosidase [Clostridia bacterium]|nr:alpha-L-fucosidase [Clostridia bacterium]
MGPNNMINRFRFRDARDWFNEKRFGAFIHWGLYAIPAWHEQMSWRGGMPRKDYEQYASQFNPVKFNPDEWMRLFKEVGMEFVCLTTKHHDGFCMYDTKYTDYNIMNTPYKKDILRMVADASKRAGIVMGTYYSIPDWHHPNYPNQGRHHEMFGPRAGDDPDYDKYFAFMENQVREIMTQYGEIGQLFWDINVAEYTNTAFNDEMRRLQPSMVINNRGPANWDYTTPERSVPDGMEFEHRTLAVQSLGRESWGYKTDEDHYTKKYLTQSIDRVLAMGGNYMLNIGPKADGTLDEDEVAMLSSVGDWYRRVGESFGDAIPATSMITGVTKDLRDKMLLTRRGNTVYVHLYEDPAANGVVVKPFDQKPLKATLLNNGQPLEWVVNMPPSLHREKREYLRLRKLPLDKFTDEPLVIKLEFDQSICE